MDKDLKFLRELTSKELHSLASAAIGCEYTDLLHKSFKANSSCEKYYPDHKRYLNFIAEQIQKVGCSSVGNFFRGGKGTSYAELVSKCARDVKVPSGGPSLSERRIIAAAAATMLEEAYTESDSFDQDVRYVINNTSLGPIVKAIQKEDYINDHEALAVAIRVMLDQGGIESYKIAVTVASSVVLYFLDPHSVKLGFGKKAIIRKLDQCLPGAGLMYGDWKGDAENCPGVVVILTGTLRLLAKMKEQNLVDELGDPL